MHYIPIKTRRLNPPQDDVYAVLRESLTDLQEGDVVLVTSKIVAIHQGRCVPTDQVDKKALVKAEAEYSIEGHQKFNYSPLAIKHNALFYAAGIDESNADNHYILLPHEPFVEAEKIWSFVREQSGVENLGIIITDSHSIPLRSGSIGTSIAWWGIDPCESHKGKKDLFGRPLAFSTTNIVDCLAAGGGAVSGESSESTPLIIVRDVPNLTFTDQDTREQLFRSGEDDIYYPLLKPFYKK
jgi:F420-0:gamma-glutamyl ligase